VDMIPAPFKTPIFGGTLEDIMEFQREKMKLDLQIPKVLVFLCNCIVELGGSKQED